uniref:Uncharacterized protein n=3 Tax=viral metagenome TaxID=1070528 RepID=A0A6H1ZCD3_9ZZZZ
MGCGALEKEKSVSLEPMKEQWQKDLQGQLSQMIAQYLPQYEPGKDYPKLSSLMTPSTYEQQGLDYLQDYISGGIKPTGVMGQAEGVLSKTLGGEYDPFTSEYYESLRRNVEKERKQAMKSLNQQISKAGLGGSSYRAGRIADVEQESFDRVSDILAQLQETERVNQLNAIQTAMGFSDTAESQIQKKLSTIMNIGSLPRLLEGVGYEDFMRKQGEYGSMVDLANQLYQYNIPYGKKSMSWTEDSGLALGLSKMMSIVDPVGSYMGIYNIPKSGDTAQSMQGLGKAMELYSAWKGVGRETSVGGLNQGSSLSSIAYKDMTNPQFQTAWQKYQNQ